MLRDLRSEIVNLNLSSPLTQGSPTGTSVLGNSHSPSLPLRQANTVPQLTVNSPEGLADTSVPQATGGRNALSVSQGSTSAVHPVSCQPVPQAQLTVPENSFMASLQQQASGALAFSIQLRFLARRRVMLTPVWRRSLLIYSHKISTVATLNTNNVYSLVVSSISRGQLP